MVFCCGFGIVINQKINAFNRKYANWVLTIGHGGGYNKFKINKYLGIGVLRYERLYKKKTWLNFSR